MYKKRSAIWLQVLQNVYILLPLAAWTARIGRNGEITSLPVYVEFWVKYYSVTGPTHDIDSHSTAPRERVPYFYFRLLAEMAIIPRWRSLSCAVVLLQLFTDRR